MSTLKCDDCGREMIAAFGMQGMTLIAAHPTCCPECGSERLVKIASGWAAAEPDGDAD